MHIRFCSAKLISKFELGFAYEKLVLVYALNSTYS